MPTAAFKDEGIIAIPPIITSVENIIPRTTIERIVTKHSIQDIITFATVQIIIFGVLNVNCPIIYARGLIISIQIIIPAPTIYNITTTSTIQAIIALASLKQVIAIFSLQKIIHIGAF